MINYELAKQLKEAGFPQQGENKELWKGNCEFTDGSLRDVPYGLYELPEDTTNMVYKPTLSELIEACGDEFGSMERRVLELGIIQNIIVWDCWGSNPQNQGYGSTPEIAVAKLWLELNNK